MLAPLSWLKDYVEIEVSPEELERRLFSAGFEVEELIRPGNDIHGVVVGKVLSAELIPDTHISVCKVDCGDKGVLQICCGADNVRPGGKYPAALEGAQVYATARDHVTVEGLMTIKKGKLRGEVSEGMLCSGVELGLTEELYPGAGYVGLLVLPEDAVPGEDVKPLVGLDEVIFDIAVTANRPDCQGMIGVAREVAAVLDKPFRMPALDYAEDGKEIDFSVEVLAPDLCPRYLGHYVSDIKIAPSPAWMQRRLKLVGINAISNVVDITNYVLKEFGQPMHAFDLADLREKRIVVRRAKPGEEIVTLDEKTFALTEDNLVICDGERPVALAGIMGGLNSEIKDTTKDVVFEAAKFARDNVRHTARALGQNSDSSARFEKGVDEWSTEQGMKRALHLIEELECGRVSKTSARFAEDPSRVEPRPLKVSLGRIDGILGVEVPREEILKSLSALSFSPEIDGDELSLRVPAYREDIDDHAQDIAEEVIRSWGYEHIVPRFLDSAQVTSGGLNAGQKKLLKLKNALAKAGFYESIFYSFFSPKDLDMLHFDPDAPERKAIRIKNPISEDLSLMRTTLLPSMLNAVVRNLRRGNTEGRFFESANIFLADKLPLESYPEERAMLSAAAFGDGETFFTMKSAPEAIAKAFGVRFTYEKTEKPFLHPGMTAKILLDGDEVGFLGKLSYEVAEELAVEKPVFLLEMDAAKLLEKLTDELVYRPVPRYPTEKRDLALVTPEETTAETVRAAIASSSKYLTRVELFDVYRSASIGEGKKSMAFNLVFTPDSHEFTAEEIDKIVEKILRKLSHTLGIELR